MKATCCVLGPLHPQGPAASRGVHWRQCLGTGFSELWWRRPLEAALGIPPAGVELDTQHCALLGCQQVPRAKCERALCPAAPLSAIFSSQSRRRGCPHLQMGKQP